ncbi:MAG: sugar ABC transporter permease [Chloroflexaceae bacterium]|nr:sugar ABC transporter permease [Chloroflexaceae bacterium]
MEQAKGAVVAPNPAARRKPLHLLSWNGPWLWLAPTFVLLFLYSVVPLIFNLYRSFSTFDTMDKEFVWSGGENWATLATDERLLNSLQVTLTYTIIALTLQFLLGLGIALLFDREPWGVGVLQTLFILPMVVPPAIAGMIFRLLQHPDFGVISWLLYSVGLLTPEEPLIGGTGRYALFGVMLVDMWQWTPFFALILLAGLKSLPSEPLEAAQVDGANAWQRFWHVKLPLLRSVIAVAVLFRLIDLFRTFDYVFILTAGGPGTATTTLSYLTYRQYITINWGYTATLGVFILALIWISAYAYTRVFKVKW